MNSILTTLLACVIIASSAQANNNPTLENPLLEDISFFAKQITSQEASLEDYQSLISKIQSNNSFNYETKVSIETHLLTAFKKSNDEREVHAEVATALQIAKEALISATPLESQGIQRDLSAQIQPPVGSQALPPTPYPSNLGFSYKDPLEFCDITSLADQVLNTNYKDLNLQLRQRFKDKTIDELAELIIHQRSMDMASYAAMASTMALGTSIAAEHLPASLGGAARTGTLIGGKLTAVTGAAAASATLMYLDICSYAQQNARMIFQLTDLYDTGSFYTTDEKQKFAWQVLMYSMTGKAVQKFAVENTTTRNVGNLAKDVYYSVLTKGGNLFRGIFEQISSGLKSGSLNADTQSALLPKTPQLPGTPVAPGTPGIANPPTAPRPIEQPRDIEIARVTPWSLLGTPANAVLTYYSTQSVGKIAMRYIKEEQNKVYSLPLSTVYAQEAIFKVLIYAALASDSEGSETRSVVDLQKRNFIKQTFMKLNPHLNLTSKEFRRIQSEMDEYNSTIPVESASVFNEELNSVPVKRALIRLVIELLYQDETFDLNDRKVLKTIQVQILGLQDPNFSDLIFRDIISAGNH